jgi:chromosome segregation ATPase
MDATMAKASLLDLGFDEAQAAEILAGAPKIKEQIAASGLRQKSFDLDTAQEAVSNLETQIKALTDQLATVELAATARRAVEKAKDELAPKQDVYTLDDISTAVQKGMTDAIKPLVEQLTAQGERSVHLWERLNTLDTIAKTASASLNELSGELPRALRTPPRGRYVDAPVTTNGQGGADQGVPNASVQPGDVFGWVDDFVNDLGSG